MASSSSIPTASWHALSAATMARNNCMFPCLLSVLLNAVDVSCSCLYILPSIPGPRGYLPCKKEGDKKRGVESKTSIFKVELFAKMAIQKKRAYSHVFLERKDMVQPKHNDYIISYVFYWSLWQCNSMTSPSSSYLRHINRYFISSNISFFHYTLSNV